jgi:hypothetical protein
LKEGLKLSLDLFYLVEEVVLVSFLLREQTVHQLLELLRTCRDRQLVDPQRLVAIINEVNNDILGYFYDGLLVLLYFLLALHDQQSIIISLFTGENI